MGQLLRSARLLCVNVGVEGAEEVFVSLVFFLGLLEGSLRVVAEDDVVAVDEEEELNNPGRHNLQKLFDSDEVLETLGHLETLYVEVPHVNEVVDPVWLIVVGLGLRKLILVMREDKVNST